MKLQTLPIDAFLGEIVGKFKSGANLVLRAEPGAGKSTRVPPALLRAIGNGKEILVLEPRRLAAKLVANRISEELGEKVGATVGYQFRFEKVDGPQTRLRFLTEGTFTRMMAHDPTLSRVAAVVFDEFHERSLQADVALAFCRQLQKHSRQDLKLVVMSATLDVKQLNPLLDNPEVIDCPGKTYPLEIQYIAQPSESLERSVKQAVRSAIENDKAGRDILVFLPGMAEIRRSEEALRTLRLAEPFDIYILHGDLTREDQERALNRAARRRIVLSTNIAETSLTIDGIGIVIDSGLHRSAGFSSWSGMPSLRTRPICQASATQRAGRAARTSAGLAYRLYSKHDFETRPAFDAPEILRSDLSGTFLELLSAGVDPSRLEFLTPPEPASAATAWELLRRLDAIDDSHRLTEVGKAMSKIPAHPRLARILVSARGTPHEDDALKLVTLLMEGALDGLDAELALRRQSLNGFQRQISERLKNSIAAKGSGGGALGESVLKGFPDRVAKKRERSASRVRQGQLELVLSSGGSVAVNDVDLVHGHSYFVLLEVREEMRAGMTLRASSLFPIEEDWLLDGLQEQTSVSWDPERQRIRGTRRLLYDRIVIDEKETTDESTDTLPILLKECLGLTLDRARSLALEEVAALTESEDFLLRVAFLMKHAGKASLSVLDWPALRERWLVQLSHLRSRSDISAIDWPIWWRENLPPDYTGSIDRLAPAQITLPNKRTLKLQYRPDGSVRAESRLQDFFGLTQGPSLLNAQIPVTLELLAPNYRAVQVTQDLSNFWKTSYPPLKKDLSRRYPKHSWPDSPQTATPPEKRGRR